MELAWTAVLLTVVGLIIYIGIIASRPTGTKADHILKQRVEERRIQERKESAEAKRELHEEELERKNTMAEIKREIPSILHLLEKTNYPDMEELYIDHRLKAGWMIHYSPNTINDPDSRAGPNDYKVYLLSDGQLLGAHPSWVNQYRSDHILTPQLILRLGDQGNILYYLQRFRSKLEAMQNQ